MHATSVVGIFKGRQEQKLLPSFLDTSPDQLFYELQSTVSIVPGAIEARFEALQAMWQMPSQDSWRRLPLTCTLNAALFPSVQESSSSLQGSYMLESRLHMVCLTGWFSQGAYLGAIISGYPFTGKQGSSRRRFVWKDYSAMKPLKV